MPKVGNKEFYGDDGHQQVKDAASSSGKPIEQSI